MNYGISILSEQSLWRWRSFASDTEHSFTVMVMRETVWWQSCCIFTRYDMHCAVLYGSHNNTANHTYL